jgi:hypothetical protein
VPLTANPGESPVIFAETSSPKIDTAVPVELMELKVPALLTKE